MVAAPLQLPAQDAPAFNPDQVLRDLEKIEKDRTQTASARLAESIGILKPATQGGSASSKAYEEAIEAMELQGRRDSGQAAADWRKKNADLLRSGQLQRAVQLHTRYLLLGLQHAADRRRDTASNLASPSWAYARDLAAALLENDLANPPPAARDLLFKPVSAGVFVRWLVLEDWLPPGDSWEASAGNLAGILEKNVRPHWRATTNPQLIETWDLQLEFEAAQATDKQVASAADRFNNHDRPRLLFARAADRAAIGQPNRAVNDVMQLLRDYPANPDAAEWAGFVRRQLPASQPPSEDPKTDGGNL
jgi:hypothetical protein